MIKKILYILAFSGLFAGLVMATGFSLQSNMAKPCTVLEVNVISRSGNYFIDEAHIRNKLVAAFDTLENRRIDPLLLGQINDMVQEIPFIKHAEVYRTINGSLKVNAVLRDPLARIINSNNQSFYIDTEGKMFPLSDMFTARVMLVTGNIRTRYSAGADLAINPDGEVESGLQGLFELASYIHADEFWRAFTDHITVLPGGKYELVPKNGAHIIEFGEATDIAEKFSKLLVFYQNGLSRLGWDHYKRVNLEFNNQIICSK